jgi:hypothetical protein
MGACLAKEKVHLSLSLCTRTQYGVVNPLVLFHCWQTRTLSGEALDAASGSSASGTGSTCPKRVHGPGVLLHRDWHWLWYVSFLFNPY